MTKHGIKIIDKGKIRRPKEIEAYKRREKNIKERKKEVQSEY